MQRETAATTSIEELSRSYLPVYLAVKNYLSFVMGDWSTDKMELSACGFLEFGVFLGCCGSRCGG